MRPTVAQRTSTRPPGSKSLTPVWAPGHPPSAPMTRYAEFSECPKAPVPASGKASTSRWTGLSARSVDRSADALALQRFGCRTCALRRPCDLPALCTRHAPGFGLAQCRVHEPFGLRVRPSPALLLDFHTACPRAPLTPENRVCFGTLSQFTNFHTNAIACSVLEARHFSEWESQGLLLWESLTPC